MISFKDGFKRARKRTGLSQAEFANKYNFSLPSVKKWEQGKAVPEYDTLISLCEIFACDMSYLFYQIDMPTHDLQFIHEQTGLSNKAIEKLMLIAKSNKITWWGDSLNSIIENSNFLDLLHTITDYIDDRGDDAQIINVNVVANSTKTVKCSDILQYKAQSLLFAILCEAKNDFENREDYRIFYSLIYNHEKSGNLRHDQAIRCIEKLDRGDLSDFTEGGKQQWLISKNAGTSPEN